MKKVAIVTQKIVMVGIEKALIEMLKEMPADEYEIDLYLFHKGGELEKFIPQHVNLIEIYGKEKSVKEKIINQLRKGRIIKAIKILYLYFMLLKVYKEKGQKGEEYLLKVTPNFEKKYDVAITYMFAYSFGVRFTLEKINALKKLVWIHGETDILYTNDKDDLKKEWHKKNYEKYDKIYCVSKDNKVNFLSIFPSLRNKVDIFYNILNKELIQKMAIEKIDALKKNDEIVLVTVARLAYQKGQDRIVEIMKELLLKNYKVIWYLVGDGPLRNQLEESIKKEKLEKNIILLGTKLNPYPYIKECDLYIQPSRDEGYCLTLAEAKILKKPIVTTEFAGSFEQIDNNINGLRVKNNTESILEGITYLLNNKEIQEKFKSNLEKEEKWKNKNIEEIIKEKII